MATDAYRTFYEAIQPEAGALLKADLLQVNVDPEAAVLLVVGVLPRIRSLRDQIIDQLPRFDISRVDKLEALVKAFGHAHALHLAANAPSKTVSELATRAGELCDSLEADASVLARRGLLDAAQFARLTVKQPGKRAFKTLVFQLIGLVELFRTGWASAKDNTPVTEDELAEGERLAAQLGDAIGLRTVGNEEDNDSSEAAVQRRRFYTLFYTAYDRVRAAVAYLRWDHDDADEYAPSLHTRERKPLANDESDSDVVVTDTRPLATDVRLNGEQPMTPPGPAPEPVRPGFPGGEPFEPEPAKN